MPITKMDHNFHAAAQSEIRGKDTSRFRIYQLFHASAATAHLTSGPIGNGLHPAPTHNENAARSTTYFSAVSMTGPALNELDIDDADDSLPTYCFEPCGIKIHNLPDHTDTSARDASEHAIHLVKPLILPPRPLSNNTSPIFVNMNDFYAEKCNRGSMRRQASAIVRLPMEMHLGRKSTIGHLML